MYLNRKCLPFVHKCSRMGPGSAWPWTSPPGGMGPRPSRELGQGQEERVTCADTQGRWPRPTLPPGAPGGEAADADRVPVCRGTGCSALAVPLAALSGAVHTPHTPTLLRTVPGEGVPLQPLGYLPKSHWDPPGCPVTTASSRPHPEDPASLLEKSLLLLCNAGVL